MKFLLDKVEHIKETYFEEGRRFHKLWPFFDGLETFLFSLKSPPKSGAHIRDAVDNKRFMFMVILAMHPALAFGIYNTGLQALGGSAPLLDSILAGAQIFLPILIISYGVGLFWEFFFCIIKGHAITEGYLVSGMLIALVMPPTIPYWMMVIGISFGVILGKEVFGGSGMNILNPALTVRAFLYFTYPAAMSGNAVWVKPMGDLKNAVSGATVLGEAQTAAQSFLGKLESYYLALEKAIKAGASTVTENGQAIFPPELPAALVNQQGTFSAGDLTITAENLFLGFHPGSMGETSIVAILLGAVFLLFTRVASWRTMMSVVVGGLFTAWIFNQIGSSDLVAYQQLLNTTDIKAIHAMGQIKPNLYHMMPPYYHLLIGGFLFGAVFMATDPVSSPGTTTAKYFYGFIIGALTVVVRVANPAYPEGIMMCILFMNIFAPTLDYFVVQSRIKRRKKRA